MGLKRKIYIDFETRSAVNIARQGVYVYAEHESTDVLLACWKFSDAPAIFHWRRGEPCPPDLRTHVEAGGEIDAFNAAFERLLWRHVLAPKYGWPRAGLKQFRCTAVTAAALNLPRSLDGLASALGLSQQKDTEGKRLIRRYSMPHAFDEQKQPVFHDLFAPENAADLAAFEHYNMLDVLVEEEADLRMPPLSDSEMEIYWLNEQVNDFGLRVDLDAAKAAMKIVAEEKRLLSLKLSYATGGAVTSVSQVARLLAWVRSKGVETESLQKADVDELLEHAQAQGLPDDVRYVLELRAEGAKPSVDKLKAMLDRTCKDGRMRGVYLCHGAGQTGRFCVAAETLVETDRGKRPIVHLQEGDKVLTHRGRFRRVTALICKGVETMFCLRGPRGETVTATGGHKILTSDGWRRLDECFEKTVSGHYALRERCNPISVFNEDHGGDSRAIRDYLSHSLGHYKSAHSDGGTQEAAQGLSFESEDGGIESDVRASVCGGAHPSTRLRGRVERDGLHLRAPEDRRRVAGAERFAAASGGAPSGRGQIEQLSRQYCDSDEGRTSASTQTDSWTLVCVGEREVWDISVDGDKSYVAQGLIHHNSCRGAQMHNLPRTRKIFDEEDIDPRGLFENISEGSGDKLRRVYKGDLGKPLLLLSDALRGFIMAGGGNIIFDADYSSIEGRVAAWVTNEGWKVEAFEKLDKGEGYGVYEMAAAGIYNVPVQEVDKSKRATGKVAELSCQYETGVGGIRKFARQSKIDLAGIYEPLWGAASKEVREKVEKSLALRVAAHDRNVVELGREGWLAGELIKVGWRAKHPAIVSAWKNLNAAATNAILRAGEVVPVEGARDTQFLVTHGFLLLRLPSGRCLAYASPKIEELEAPWADKTVEKAKRERKDTITVAGVAGGDRFARYPVHGGAFFNNLVQGLARDILARGMLNLDAEGYRIVGHTHDEIFCEMPWESSLERMCALMCDLPEWAKGLPLTAEGWKAKRYRK